MPFIFKLLVVAASMFCTLVYGQSDSKALAEAPLKSRAFYFKDGGTSSYLSFAIGGNAQPDTLIFFYGGSGCRSWHSVMPGYVKGIGVDARILVLNKRFVPDAPSSSRTCSTKFNRANNPEQWASDYSEFITAQLAATMPRPRNVVLVGVSEGALVAVKVARLLPEITHVAIIGSGAWSMRTSLRELHLRGAIPFNVDDEWKKLALDHRSLQKQWFGNPYRWWADVMDIEPAADYLALSVPVIVGFGDKDESVPVESALALKAAFEAAGKNNLSLVVYPGADHRLSAGDVSYRPAFFSSLSDHLR